jgi:membrane protein implicated in regulation of membrane protease activity
MSEKDSSSPSDNAMPSTAKLEAIIYLLTLLTKIGKYLPWIVLIFALTSLTVALLSFIWWHSIGWGIFNSILAFGGFLFFGQLVSRRKTHRQEYRYTGRHLHRISKSNEKEDEYTERIDSSKSN